MPSVVATQDVASNSLSWVTREVWFKSPLRNRQTISHGYCATKPEQLQVFRSRQA